MRAVVFGTAGHIDHGKSALVRALTGIDPDRLKEEKARGITIDLGFAHFEQDGIAFALVDVPGHERFVKNMLAGATGIDHVLLVVAADESVMPQTREHFDICRLLDVRGGVIALTKTDLVDLETIEIARLEVQELVKGSVLEGAPIVPVSSKTAAGLLGLREEMVRLVRNSPERAWGSGGAGHVARVPIDRVFTVKGFGTVVTGTLVSGEVHEDEELILLPMNRRVKVRGVQVHGQKKSLASAGQRVALNLGGIEVGDLHRGQTLATPGSFDTTERVDVRLELLASARPLKHGARVRFHQGTTEILGRVAFATPLTASGDEPTSAAVLQPCQWTYARIRLESPAVLTRDDRYVIRAYSPPLTIGGGVILDPHPPRTAIRTSAGRRRFERLDSDLDGPDRLDEALVVMVEERGASGLPLGALTSRAAVPPRAANETVERLTREGRAVLVGDTLVGPRVLAHLRERLVAELHAHHEKQPLSDGVPREELRARVFGRASAEVFGEVLGGLAAEGRLVARERVALAGHQVSLSPDEQRARDVIERLLRDAGLTPPDQAALRLAAGVAPDLIDRVVALLVRQKVIVRLETLLFHADALERLKADVATLRALGTPPTRIDVPAFKDRYGITRKYAIPLLEYLDRERVTRRLGDSRVVI